MRSAEGPARFCWLLCALVAGGSGCGLANGAGLVGHLLYEDEVAICGHCADEGEACAELDDGKWGCRPFADLQSCEAAQNLFFEHEEDGPFLTPARGQPALEDGFSGDCEGGRNSVVANVLVFDPQYDSGLRTDWSLEEDGAERQAQVTLTDVDQQQHNPSLWDVQILPSDDGTVEVDRLEIVFCVSVVLEQAVALQVADKAGHHSNAICLDGLQ